MEFILTPFEAVGPIKFGTSPDEVRTALNSPWNSFRKFPSEIIPTDAFDELGIHVYYTSNSQCEAIECFSPVLLTFRGKSLVGQPYQEVREWLISIDSDTVHGDTGIAANSFGIGLYTPDGNDDPDAIIESVTLVDKGYYSRRAS
jgi:hypothetical protein